MEKLLMRPAEAAEAIGVSRSKFYELLADGSIPAVRIGKSIRVPFEGLQKWARSLEASCSEENLINQKGDK